MPQGAVQDRPSKSRRHRSRRDLLHRNCFLDSCFRPDSKRFNNRNCPSVMKLLADMKCLVHRRMFTCAKRRTYNHAIVCTDAKRCMDINFIANTICGPNIKRRSNNSCVRDSSLPPRSNQLNKYHLRSHHRKESKRRIHQKYRIRNNHHFNKIYHQPIHQNRHLRSKYPFNREQHLRRSCLKGTNRHLIRTYRRQKNDLRSD